MHPGRAQRLQQVVEGFEVVRADHGVAVRPSGGHPADFRPVPLALRAGVRPHDPVGDPVQPRHLRAEQQHAADLFYANGLVGQQIKVADAVIPEINDIVTASSR